MRAVVARESSFHQFAVSSAGAQGYAQLMPGTSRAEGVCSPFDRTQNVLGGAGYLRELLDRFHGNVRLAIAAYNAGPGAVERFGGVPPYRETQVYVRNVLGQYAKYVSAEAAPRVVPSTSPAPLIVRRASPIGETADPFRGTKW
jgi:soluble lytic murein transglycosylase-like protein